MSTDTNMEEMLNMVKLFSELQKAQQEPPSPMQEMGAGRSAPPLMGQSPQMKAFASLMPHMDEEGARKMNMLMLMMDLRDRVADIRQIMSALQNIR